MSTIEVLTEDKIARAALTLLERPMRLVELRDALRQHGILVSYTRLKKVIDQLLEEGLVSCFKYGKAVMYIKKELLT